MAHAETQRIVCIGGSAGSLDPMLKLFGRLPSDIDASFFVVQHVSANAPQYLAQLISRVSPIPAERAVDGAVIEERRIYVAPTDHHLMLRDGTTVLSHGPRENLSRPSIDALFRSAAVAYGPRVISILLSGMLDDGSAGLAAVKRCGGVTVVQDPADAAHPDMPQSAMESGQVDHCVPAERMSELLRQLLADVLPPSSHPSPPTGLALEVDVTARGVWPHGREDVIGVRCAQSCPECGGPLWFVTDDSVRRYRCRVGHAYSERALLCEQDDAIERALWVAVRTLEERAFMLESMLDGPGERASELFAGGRPARIDETRDHIEQLKQLLLRSK